MGRTKDMKFDLVRNNNGVRQALIVRWAELQKTQSDVVKDALLNGITCDLPRLNRYVKGMTTLTQEQVLWLCFRYGIAVQLVFTVHPYDEGVCTAKANAIFPKK